MEVLRGWVKVGGREVVLDLHLTDKQGGGTTHGDILQPQSGQDIRITLHRHQPDTKKSQEVKRMTQETREVLNVER